MVSMMKKIKSKNIWTELPRPILALAPMYDVTDSAFRQIIADFGHPGLFFTEFVSAAGLASDKGRPKLLRELYFTKKEQPIIAQVFGANRETMYQTGKLVAKLGFAGLDINMGCPDRAVIKQGAGAALILKPKLAREIIASAKAGAGDLPVSVKTRIGFNKIEWEKWLSELLLAEPAALTVHLRTKKELSGPPAHWELATDIARLVKKSGVPLLMNGDVKSAQEGRDLAQKYGLDGVMIGRGIFGQPWLFANSAKSLTTKRELSRHALDEEVSLEERLLTLVKHSQLFAKYYLPGPTNQKLFAGHTKNFAVMKKHFKAYVRDFAGSSELRAKLMECDNAEAVEKIIKIFLTKK